MVKLKSSMLLFLLVFIHNIFASHQEEIKNVNASSLASTASTPTPSTAAELSNSIASNKLNESIIIKNTSGHKEVPHTLERPPKYTKQTKESKQAKQRRDTVGGKLYSALRKLKERKDEQPLADARQEQNYSAPYYNNRMADQMQYGVNPEQDFNKNNNKVRQLHNIHYSLREHGYVIPAEVECNFEEPCNWKWPEGKLGFVVTSSVSYGPTDIGPMYDADNSTEGLLFYFSNHH